MNDYINKVLSGEIEACIKIKQACQRHIDDLERSKSDSFNYYYDEEQGSNAIKFIELLPSTSGEQVTMLGFQRFIISSLYGWREKGTGNRRFNRGFISKSRKNGKTFLASGIAGNSLIMEKEPAESRQVLFLANSHKQATLGYDMLSNQLRSASNKSKFLRQQLKIMNSKIEHKPSKSYAKALASDTNSLDGYAPTTAILDEWHEAKNRDVYNVIKSGQMQQKNGLLCVISTAGFDLTGPMYEEYLLLDRVLKGEEEADRYFVAIWELDDEEEIHDQSKWIKANPIFESEEIKKTMVSAIQDDVNLAIKQNNLNAVLTKNFNMWKQSNEQSYISIEDWKAVEVPKMDIKGKPVYIGLDLSVTNDLSSVSWLVPLGDNRFYTDSFSFVATKHGLEAKEKRDNLPYRELEKAGECSITTLESGITDYMAIFNFIRELIDENELDCKAIGYDPYNSGTLVTMLEMENYPLVAVNQWVKTLTLPTVTLREQIYEKNIIHPKNTILTNAMNNAITKVVNDSIVINKAKNSNKIDPLDALLNAYLLAMDHYTNETVRSADNEFYKSNEFSF